MVVTPAKARRNRIAAVVLALGAVLLLLLFGWFRVRTPGGWVGFGAFSVVVGVGTYLFLNRKYRRRARVLATEFPEEWRRILSSKVMFYAGLEEHERRRFEAEVAIFLDEKRITGIKTEVDALTRLLVAASAVIPIFGFPEWEYDNLAEVLIYPGSFNEDYEMGTAERHHILGMVGTAGSLNRMMILSKPDLIRGFQVWTDRENVGIHEFAHLVDGADGSVDGVPAAACPDCVKPWIKVMHEEMARIEDGDSMLREYGLTNQAEFFAVASEAFFDSPGRLAEDHPKLYGLLERIFHQNARSRLGAAVRDMVNPRPRAIGRNSKCPCGSKKKFKKCCLGNC